MKGRGSTYENMDFPEVRGFSVDNTYFDVEGLDFKVLFEHSLVLNFRHVLCRLPEKVSKGDQSLRFNAVFYYCPKGIVMVTCNCLGMAINTHIGYVRGARRTIAPVTYFCAFSEIKCTREPWIHFVGNRASYPHGVFMDRYYKKMDWAKKQYDRCMHGYFLPDTDKELERFNHSDKDTGVYMDEGGMIHFIKIRGRRYRFVPIVNISKIEKFVNFF